MVKPFPQVASEPWWAPPLRAPAADASRRRTSSDRGGTSGRGSDCGGGGFLGEKSAGNVGKNDGNVEKNMQNMEKSLDMWKKSSEN